MLKRRALVAVLPMVATVVLAGTGDATSAATGAIGATQGEPWTGSRGTTESVASIAARQKLENRRTGGKPSGIREKPEPGHSYGEAHPKLPGPAVPQLPPRTSTQAGGPSSSLAASTSFLGAQVSESGFIPPDSMGSVGPTQALVDVNGRIKVFDKQGNLGALNVTDSVFWSSVSNGAGATDPGVEYDRLSGRWIVSAVNEESTNNRVMIAVSSGPTITDSTSFTFYFFNHNAPSPAGDSGLFADYPQLGVDKNAVYVGVNDFGSTFSNTSAFVIRKSSVLGGGPIVVTAFRGLAVGSGPGPFSPQPATDMDPSVNEGYIVGVDNQSFSQLDIRRISDPGGTPSISGNLTVPVPATYFPLDVPQGTHGSLDALDDRLFEAMIARGPSGALSLWTAHNIRVNSSGVASSSGDRDADRWYELGTLSTTPSLIQSGTLFDSAASNPRFFWIPSIAASGQGHASLNSSTAGSGLFAEVASSGRLAGDPTGATEPFDITQTNTSSYQLGSGQPKRWGDYSQTVVDPTDNQTFWTFQEYANATNSWGVQVIKLKAPPPATPSAASPSTISAGQPSVSVQITGTSTGGSGFFDPGPDTGGPGFPNHISGSVSGGVTVNSVTYTDPTHVTLDLDTSAASNGAKDVTITNPDGQSSTASNLINIGTDTTPPDPPTLTGTTPSSPANNNSPKIQGSAEAGSTMALYTNAGCTGAPVATGSAASFASPGTAVSVPDDSTTTFHAAATDTAGNTSACSSSSVTYIEDSTPPAGPTSLASSPASPANDNSPEITGTAESGATVKVYKAQTTSDCTVGNLAVTGPAATFASPGVTVSVSDNTTTILRATATDAAGNTSACSSSSVAYVEDSTIPGAPAITDTDPDSPSSTISPLVKGSASADTQTVEVFTQPNCAGSATSGTKAAFEGAGIQVTVAPNQTTLLSARALDATNNPSACSSSFPYTHDNLAPVTTIDSGPSGVTNDHSPAFTFHANETSSFQCSIDTGTASFTSCSGPGASDNPPAPLADGTYTFRVRATDQAGNTGTPATQKFTIQTPAPPDSIAPETTITKGPKKKTRGHRPSFSFASSELGSSFQCQLDKQLFAPCTSPFKPTKNLKFGTHVFRAEAIDAAGNVDATPAVRRFKVTR